MKRPLNSLFWIILFITIAPPAYADGCEVADILFGPIQFDIITYDGYETALVRSATFDNPKKHFGAILGEITVDRGSFSVRNTNQIVVGSISPELLIDGWDDACDKSNVAEFVRVNEGTHVILSGDKPVGTMVGRFPANSFGVK